jgi:hypothetical protein
MNKIKPIHLAIVAFLFFLAVNLTLQRGGFLLYGEADWFLIDHNNPDRSFISKIICPHKHDAEHYMARELAHLVEYIDARFVHWSVMAGHPHFLSISNYVFVLMICIMLTRAMERFLVNKWVICAALLLLLFSPPILTSGNYIRSGHMLATMLMVALATYLQRKTFVDTPGLKESAVTFLLSLLLVWSDRQGLVAAIAILAIIAVTRRDCWKPVCIPIVTAIAVHTFHYLYIGPKLIAAFTPFGDVITPSNILKVSGAADGASGFLDALVGNLTNNGLVGIEIAIRNIGHLLGGIPIGITCGLLGAITAGFVNLRSGGKNISVPIAFFITFFAIAGMNAIIYGAAKVLIWPDVAPIIYYNIIGTVALFMVFISVWKIWIGGFCFDSDPKEAAAIFLLACSNFGLIGGHVERFKNGHLGGFIAGAPAMREALRQTVSAPQGNNPVKYNANASAHYTDWKWVMKNPLEYGGRMTASEFVESSQYLQFVRSEKGLPFGKGGRQ